jgi:hypothetical protein
MRHVARLADRLADRGALPRDAATELVDSARSVVSQLREEACGSGRSDVLNRAGVMLIVSEFRYQVTHISLGYESEECVTEQ